MAVARAAVEEVRVKKAAEEAVVDEIMSGLQEATSELRLQLESAQVELADAERGVSGLQTEKESVQTSIQLVQSRVQGAAKAIAAAEEKIAAFTEQRAAMLTRMQQNNAEKRGVEGKDVELRAQIESLTAKELKLQSRYHKMTCVYFFFISYSLSLCVYVL